MNSSSRTVRHCKRTAGPKRPPVIRDRFCLLLACRDEAEQRKLYEELAARGLVCRVWVV